MRSALLALWTQLEQHAATLTTRPIASLFALEPDRLDRLRFEAAGLTLDLSKQLLDRQGAALLENLAAAAGLTAAITAMFRGDVINHSEGRAVLHTALRAGPHGTASVDGRAVANEVEAVLTRICLLYTSDAADE